MNSLSLLSLFGVLCVLLTIAPYQTNAVLIVYPPPSPIRLSTAGGTTFTIHGANWLASGVTAASLSIDGIGTIPGMWVSLSSDKIWCPSTTCSPAHAATDYLTLVLTLTVNGSPVLYTWPATIKWAVPTMTEFSFTQLPMSGGLMTFTGTDLGSEASRIVLDGYNNYPDNPHPLIWSTTSCSMIVPETQLQCTIPPYDVGVLVLPAVKVGWVNTAGTFDFSWGGKILYKTPLISSVSPSSINHWFPTTITITGTWFGNSAGLYFSGDPVRINSGGTTCMSGNIATITNTTIVANVEGPPFGGCTCSTCDLRLYYTGGSSGKSGIVIVT